MVDAAVAILVSNTISWKVPATVTLFLVFITGQVPCHPFSATPSQSQHSVSHSANLAHQIKRGLKVGCLEPGTICWKGIYDRKGVEKSCLDNVR